MHYSLFVDSPCFDKLLRWMTITHCHGFPLVAETDLVPCFFSIIVSPPPRRLSSLGPMPKLNTILVPPVAIELILLRLFFVHSSRILKIPFTFCPNLLPFCCGHSLWDRVCGPPNPSEFAVIFPFSHFMIDVFAFFSPLSLGTFCLFPFLHMSFSTPPTFF